MRLRLRWWEWIVLAAVGSLLVAAATAIYPGWPAVGKWWDKQDLPAWVQAVGSISAIVAAVWVVEAQHRRSIRLAIETESRRTKRRHNAIIGVALHAQKQIRDSGRAAQGCLRGELVDPTAQLELLSYAETELSGINLSELDSFYLVAGVRRMLSCVRRMRYLCEESHRVASFVAPSLAAAQIIQVDLCIQNAAEAFKDVSDKAAHELAEDPHIVLPW